LADKLAGLKNIASRALAVLDGESAALGREKQNSDGRLFFDITSKRWFFWKKS
jgi:hypothetical protein